MSEKIYQNLHSEHQLAFNAIQKRFNLFSIIRLVVFLLSALLFYFYYNSGNALHLIGGLLVLVAFLWLITYHKRISFKRDFAEALVNINADELLFLQDKEWNFDDGKEFIDVQHNYSYDLDFFGARSLFQFLNRCYTATGKKTLASYLLQLFKPSEIKKHQTAIKELAGDLQWRQDFSALSKITGDSPENLKRLNHWANRPSEKIHKGLYLFSFVSVAAFIISLILYFSSFLEIPLKVPVWLFIVNLLVLGRVFKKIKSELFSSEKIQDILKSYSKIIATIEDKKFDSEHLIQLQKNLSSAKSKASDSIASLSNIYAQLENIQNPVGAFIFNGTFLYHLHVYQSLCKWKDQNAANLIEWLEIMGHFEALISLANFSYNNPTYAFPELNDQHFISFNDLGHPLIKSENRIDNDVVFDKEKFLIVTGSNMSGKSTFLRSLGINMVLAGTGSVVCATKAQIHPLPVLVSMRLSDNLNENESYFFAEVKRLKKIMTQADERISFLLLDEILRGTNSDDKRTGTIEVIKKIIKKDALGAIATHDLKVCDISSDHEALTNKCFEVETIDNELVFDYKLREGVCKNKNATFLMKKMEII